MNVLAFGNCQVLGIVNILDRMLKNPFSITSLPCWLTEITKEDILIKIKQSSIIITQPIAGGYRDVEHLNTEFLVKNSIPGTKIIIIPSLFFTGYHFDQYYLTDKDGLGISTPWDYHYSGMLSSFIANGSVDNFKDSHLYNENLETEQQLRERCENDIEELRRRISSIEVDSKSWTLNEMYFICPCDFIKKYYRYKLLFYSINHPTKELLQWIISEILEIANLKEYSIFIDLNYDPINSYISPLYKCLRKHLYFDIDVFNLRIMDNDNIDDILRAYQNEYLRLRITSFHKQSKTRLRINHLNNN